MILFILPNDASQLTHPTVDGSGATGHHITLDTETENRVARWIPVILMMMTLLSTLIACTSFEEGANDSHLDAALTSTATPPPFTAIPSPTALPQLTATPEAETFTIVFQREGEVWLSESDGQGERPLTHEGLRTGELPFSGVSSFALSPDGRYAVYIVQDGQIDLVKVISIRDGSTHLLASTTEPLRVIDYGSPGATPWRDDRHVAYYTFELAGTDEEPVPEMKELVLVDVETGESIIEPFSMSQYPSPDGRYVLQVSRAQSYRLHDRQSGEGWRVFEEGVQAWFLHWSPNGRLMLFRVANEEHDTEVLAVVDAETRTQQVITAEARVALRNSAAWSPDGRTIAYILCDPPVTGCGNPELWLVSPDGTDSRRVPMEVSIHCTHLSWTPDGARLVFETAREPSIWSVRVDGTDLRPIANGYKPQVLPGP